MKEFRAWVENTFFGCELSIIASSPEDAQDMVEDLLDSEGLKRYENPSRSLGMVDPFYRFGSVDAYGDAPDSLSGDLLLQDERGVVALLKSGGNG